MELFLLLLHCWISLNVMVSKELKMVKMDYKLYAAEKWASFRSSIQRLNLQKHVTLSGIAIFCLSVALILACIALSRTSYQSDSEVLYYLFPFCFMLLNTAWQMVMNYWPGRNWITNSQKVLKYIQYSLWQNVHCLLHI